MYIRWQSTRHFVPAVDSPLSFVWLILAVTVNRIGWYSCKGASFSGLCVIVAENNNFCKGSCIVAKLAAVWNPGGLLIVWRLQETGLKLRTQYFREPVMITIVLKLHSKVWMTLLAHWRWPAVWSEVLNNLRTYFFHGWNKQWETEGFYPRTQHNGPSKAP